MYRKQANELMFIISFSICLKKCKENLDSEVWLTYTLICIKY